MKKIKYATWILGMVIFAKIFLANILENYVVLKLGADLGLNIESILIMIVFSILLYFLIERRK